MGACLATGDKTDDNRPIQDNFHGPVNERTCTDVSFLIFKGIFMIGLLALVGHCIVNGDLYRLSNGYDNCGNICGRVTPPAKDSKDFPCLGADMTSKKYLLIKEIIGKNGFSPKSSIRDCVSSCKDYPGYEQILNRCVRVNQNTSTLAIPTTDTISVDIKKSDLAAEGAEFISDAIDDLARTWYKIILLCILAFVLSLILLVMFRYFAGAIVWIILIFAIGVCLAITTYLWISYFRVPSVESGVVLSTTLEEQKNNYQVSAIIFTIVSVVVLLLVFFMRNKIQLVIQLFKEAAKAVADLPLLFFQPVWTFMALLTTLFISGYFFLWIQSSGNIAKTSSDLYYYKKDVAMKVTVWYNVFALYWFVQFLVGCQHMVIAGAVACWYFTRDKSRLVSPISKSWYNLVRFHLGSVAFGSFLIALVQMIKTILKSMKKSLKESNNSYAKILYCCIMCWLRVIESLLDLISRNAYIEIAIFGTTFCEGGKQAFKLLTENAWSILAINSVGDFVLFLAKVIVVAITTTIGFYVLKSTEGLNYLFVPLTLVFLFSSFISHCFITVFEMVIDTIFLCFCEDCELNDGETKPYFMNKGLMEYVKNSRRVLKIGDGTPTGESPKK